LRGQYGSGEEEQREQALHGLQCKELRLPHRCLW
jgi:hypothetical protein